MIEFHVILNEVSKVKDFVNMTTNLENDADLVSGKYVIDAKSIMGIFSMNLSRPILFRYHGNEQDVAEIRARFAA